MTKPDEILAHFFGAYFHQDWDLDDSTWQAVVKRYVGSAVEKAAHAVAQNIEKLLAQVSANEQFAEMMVHDFGCYYWAGSPSEMRVWLKSVSAALQLGKL